MAWKGVHLTRPSRLSLSNRQLCVEQDDGKITIALEDIAWIIADDPKTNVTFSLIAACAAEGIVIITSDERHMPCSITLPFHVHHRTSATVRLQGDTGLPLRKRLWQKIVRAKITNQAAALDSAGIFGSDTLIKLSGRVRSGDPDNIEARAAKDYWRLLFQEFVRADVSDWRNKALNYAYAVLRGCVARALVAAGFVPAIGLHHDSSTNSFNLADDILEPFRPLADQLVYSMFLSRDDAADLTREERQQLAALPLRNVGLRGETMSMLHAAELVAQSLVRALESKDENVLALPSLGKEQLALPLVST